MKRAIFLILFFVTATLTGCGDDQFEPFDYYATGDGLGNIGDNGTDEGT